MSFAPNPSDIGSIQAGQFQQNPELAVRRALQQRGMDPSRNFLARLMMQRANDLNSLGVVYGAGEGNFLDFANQYVQGQLGGGGQFTTDNIANRVRSQMGNPQGDFYNFLSEGDPDQQWQRYRSMQALALRGMNPYLAQSRLNTEENSFQNWYLQALQGNGQNVPQNWIDAVTGRTPPASSPTYSLPSASQPGTTTPTPPPTTPPQQGGGTATPVPGQQRPQAGGPLPTGATSFGHLLEMFRPEQRGWGVESYHPGTAFTLNGISYDPTQDTGRQYKNMSGQGRLTSRGSAFGVFLYRLNMLRNQRDMALAKRQRGEATNAYEQNLMQFDDNALARQAVDFVRQNNTGSTGFSY